MADNDQSNNGSAAFNRIAREIEKTREKHEAMEDGLKKRLKNSLRKNKEDLAREMYEGYEGRGTNHLIDQFLKKTNGSDHAFSADFEDDLDLDNRYWEED